MTGEFDLKSAGLTDTDTAVYVFLLERGSSFGGSKIAQFLHIHRQYVYNSIEKLKRLQLVEQLGTEPRPKFRALPPQQLTHLARKNLQATETLVRRLNAVSAISATQDFEIYRGEQQIFDFEESVVCELEMNETHYSIGGGSEAFIKFFGDRYEELCSTARQKSLHTKYIGCEEEREWLEYANRVVGNFEYKILVDMPKTSVQTVVRKDSVTFYSFGIPPLVYVIKSQTVRQDYKKFFDMLWNTAA